MLANEEPKKQADNFPYKTSIFLSLGTSLAMYGLLRRGHYQAAFLLYSKGGGGLNLYQQRNGQLKRVFAIDYHPFWNKKTKENIYKLHYHRGENNNQMKKHRPYEGGW
ncbi:hypothetical protein ACQUW5_02780 [Legionella sp. CNM-1927-20]|uniref:hypothetical protein n=1 Tax=Legionella sp. CNM-1927-20 TaxID=3422221 RepID=UPI00403AE78F